MQLTVADDGVGLPPGAEQRIFDRFYRADPSRSGGGAGLGLAIAAWIVREHGGPVVAANNDRGGATFSVDLPAALTAHRPRCPLTGSGTIAAESWRTATTWAPMASVGRRCPARRAHRAAAAAGAGATCSQSPGVPADGGSRGRTSAASRGGVGRDLGRRVRPRVGRERRPGGAGTAWCAMPNTMATTSAIQEKSFRYFSAAWPA